VSADNIYRGDAPPPPRRPTVPPSAAEQKHAQLIEILIANANALSALVESIDRNTAVTHTLLQAMLVASEDDEDPGQAVDDEEQPAFDVVRKP